MRELAAVWSPLAPSPLLWIVVTLVAYLFGRRLQRLLGGSALANPVLIAIVLTAAAVLASGASYATYFAGAQFINFLLGPATVALAAPLARNIRQVRGSLKGLVLALVCGSLASTLSGLALARALGGSRTIALSMAPKSVTTPIAMAVSQQIGGAPALTATLAIVGGIFAASAGRRLLTILRIHDHRAHGFAAGVAGSGVAAAEVASLGGLAAAFAALGVALNGVVTALVTPALVSFAW
ncbi:MAG TPA: LrgB family protein [Caulobacteraceae bacterium]|nr:LrgB family protein [Caulobacteraceae bacterium]